MKRRQKIFIGGFGVHGITLAARLRKHDLVAPDDLTIMDRYDRPLWVMGRRLQDCRTQWLRSGPYDHVAPDRNSLIEFAASNGRAETGFNKQWGVRPCSKLFVEHTRWVAEQFRLTKVARQGLITALTRAPDGQLVVTTSNGVYRADRVYLAMGMDAPDEPEWTRRFAGHDLRISHVFDRDYELAHLPEGMKPAVVGAGITAIQVARSLVETRKRQVLLVTRRPLDVPPGRTKSDDWYDPARRKQLCLLGYPERIRMLREDGDRGTIPPWDRAWLDQAIRDGTVEHKVCSIAHLEPKPDAVEMILMDGSVIPVSLVVLATGLRKSMHEWLQLTAAAMKLPLHDMEPLLTDDLEWGEGSGIFVLGHHAGPCVGPYAGNISGGISAAEICCDGLAKALSQ